MICDKNKIINQFLIKTKSEPLNLFKKSNLILKFYFIFYLAQLLYSILFCCLKYLMQCKVQFNYFIRTRIIYILQTCK